MLSTSSLPDDRCDREGCGHQLRAHTDHLVAKCLLCPADLGPHPFVPRPEPEAPDPNAICACGHQHRNHTSSRCCACDALAIKGFMHAFRLSVEPPEVPIVDVELPEPEAPDPGDRCTCKHKRKHHTTLYCGKCYDKGAPAHIRSHGFELQAIEDWPCGDCGATVPGDLDWCPSCPEECEGGCRVYTEPPCDLKCCGGEWWAHGCKHSLPPEEPPPCPAPGGCAREDCKHGCAWAADELTRLGQEMEAARPLPPSRRPPYAVAYAITDGHVYELALPGDATVIAEDGILKISHPGAVLALVQARPMEVPDGDV